MTHSISDMFPNMADILPEGEKGLAKIEHVTVSKEDADLTRLRAMIGGDRWGAVPEGTYAHLRVQGGLMMSDTRMERMTNYGVIHNSKGDVLIAGLGLGMVLFPILAKQEVKSVLVIEKYQDVIDLVEPTIREKMTQVQSKKLTVLCADIFDWKPPKGQKWDTIYFDIWPDITLDNLEEMSRLHRKFARRKTSKAAWMHSWRRDDLLYRRQQERRMGW